MNNDKELYMKTIGLILEKFLVMSLISLFLLLHFSSAIAATYTYTYDNLDRLTGVTADDGTFIASYTYDDAGNRLSMEIQGVQLETPSVTDSGEYSLDASQLDVHVTTYGSEYGNLGYYYGLGASCGLTDIQDWSEFIPDENGNILLDTLNLPHGDLFISTQIVNFAGEIVSETGCSDGILILDPFGDYDNDTFTNITEDEVGSNPLNFNSRPGDTAIPLSVGYNMIAIPADLYYPVDLGDSLTLLGDSTEIEKVMAYDHTTGEFITLIPEDPANPGFILNGGEGLIVYAIQQKDINFTTVRCVAPDLQPGINLIEISCPPVGYTATEFLVDTGAENLSGIQRFNHETGAFETLGFDSDDVVVGDDFPIVPGEGYFVFVKE